MKPAIGTKRTHKILLAACAAVLAGSTGASAVTKTWTGANANNSSWTTATNWLGNDAPDPHDSLVFDGFARLTPNNDFAAGTAFDGITFTSSAGAFNLVGNQITLSGNIIDNTAILPQTISLAMLLDGNRTVDVTNTGSLTLGGIISGNFGLTKTGLGTLLLTANNSFSGNLMINSGVVSVGSDLALGDTTAGPARLVIDGGILRTTANMTIATSRGIALGNAAGGGGTVDVNNGTTLTYGGVIANNGGVGGLTKLSFGNLVLSGANTYTGTTAIRNGGLTLNFAAAGAPASNIISSSSNLVLGGANAGLGGDSFAALTLTGSASANSTQTFNGTTIDVGLNRMTVTRGATNTATLNLGALSQNNGGILALAIPTANGGVVNTTTPNTNGILGGWATIGTGTVQRGIMVGTDWASVDASGNIVPYTGYKAAVAYDPANVAGTVLQGNVTAADNVRLPSTFTENTEVRVAPDDANVTVDINTWAWQNVPTPTGNGHVLTIGRGNTLRLGVDGGIFRQSTANNRNFYIGGAAGGGLQTGSGASGSQNVGNLTAGGPNINTPGEIVITVNNDSQTSGSGIIEARIVDNGTGAVSLVKAGSGALKIDGNNTYSGGTYIMGGRLQLAGSELGTGDPVNPAIGNPDGLGTGPIHIVPGGQLFASGINPDLTAGATTFDNITPSANDAIISNAIFIAGSGTQQETLGAIRLGNRSNMTGQMTLTGDTRLAGGNAPTYNLNYPTRTELTVTMGNLLSGKITGNFNLDFGAAASINTDATITNSANDYSGTTQIIGRGGGNARLRLGGNNVIPDGAGKGNVILNANGPAVLDLMGFNETINGLSSAGSTNTNNAIVENNGWNVTVDTSAGPNLHAYVFTPRHSTLTLGGFDQTATFAGIIRNNDPALVITLPNPNWNGSPDPNNRNAPDADGDTPTLTGITNPAITAGSTLGVTKIGAGLQTLSGNNEYTGDTNINNGTLSITGQLSSNGAVKVNSSATSAGTLSGTGSVGNVTVAANTGSNRGRIAPGLSSAVGSIGTLTMSSLTMNGGDIRVDVGQGFSDSINVGSATFAAPTTISPGPSGSAGSYTILNSNTPITYTVQPTLVMPTLTRSTFSLDTSNPNAIVLNVVGGSKSLTWTGNQNGRWDIVGAQNWTDGLVNERYFDGDAVTFQDGPTNRNLVLDAAVNPSSLNFNNSTGNDYTITGVGSIGGSTTLVKDGSGRVVLATNNTYSGTTTVNTGTLQIGNGGTSGTLGTGDVNVHGTLAFNRSDNINISQVINGAGGLEKLGTNTLTLSGLNNYEGATVIRQGIINSTNNNSVGNPNAQPVQVLSGAAFDIAGNTAANDVNFGNKIFMIAGDGVNGSGALTNSGNVGQINAFQQVVLTDNASVGGNGRFDIRVPEGTPGSLDLAGKTLTKRGNNQFSLVNVAVSEGNIVVDSGNFAIEAGTSIPDFGVGTITYNSGTTAQFFQNVAPSLVLRKMIFNGNVTTGNAGGQPATIGSNMVLNGTLTVEPLGQNNTTLTFTGDISETNGSRSIVKNGTHTLVLRGNSTYSGGTAVNGGTLRVINTTGSATGTGPVTLAADSTLSGMGTIAGKVTAAGTSHIAPIDDAGLGSPGMVLTLGQLELAGASNIDLDGSGSSFDALNITGLNGLTFTGNALLNITQQQPFIPGDYTIIDYAGTPIGSLAGKLSLSSTTWGENTGSIFDDAASTSIKLRIGGPATGNPQWDIDLDGTWGQSTNWSPQTVPDGSTAVAQLLGRITAPRTITLDGNRTVAGLIFDNPNKYTIASGAGSGVLNISDASNPGTITVTTGSHEISAPVVVGGETTVDVATGQALRLSGGTTINGGAVTKNGGGTLRITGTAAHAAGATLVARQGTVELDSNNGTAANAQLTVNVTGNTSGADAAVVLNADQHLKGLSVAFADAGSQTLDLKTGAGAGEFRSLRVYAADLSAAKTSLASAIRNANAAGAPLPTDGIIDSGLHTNARVGIARMSDHVFIRPTRLGDLNLDGNVTIADFIDLASNFNSTGATWQEGDLNYDATVTIADFIDLAANFNGSYSGGLAGVAEEDRMLLANFASSIGVDASVIGSAVPEPATLSLLAVGAMGLMSRRRRKA